MKIKTKQVIEVQDWDQLVIDTYRKPYSFQQQDGCKERGVVYLTVPGCYDDYENDRVPEIINGDKMGVSFKAWLERDPSTPLNPTDEELDDCAYYYKDMDDRAKWCASKHNIELFYERNFYPDVQMIAHDLHCKGLLPAGEYMINIDW